MADSSVNPGQRRSEEQTSNGGSQFTESLSSAAKLGSRLLLSISWFIAIIFVSLNLRSPSPCDRDFIGCVGNADRTPAPLSYTASTNKIPPASEHAQQASSTNFAPGATATPLATVGLPAEQEQAPPGEPKPEALPPSTSSNWILNTLRFLSFYGRHGPSRALEWSLLSLIVAPYLVGWWLILILKFAVYTIDYRLQVPTDLSGSEGYWAERARCVQFSWDYESLGRERSQIRAEEYAHLIGWFTSLSLAGGVLLLVHTPVQHPYIQSIALTILAAIVTSFLLEIGAIFVRIANNDVSARLFASALHTLLTVMIAAAFLPAALSLLHETTLAGTSTGQALLGIAVGLIGRNALGVITVRANSILGIKTVTPENRAELKTSIDGMNEEDIDRLAEEGVDSVHALAYTPAPRLFFGTLYRLQRICDWQDQALLIELAGSSLAQAFRSNLVVRGAIDAQAVALVLLAQLKDNPAPTDDQLEPLLLGRRPEIRLDSAEDCFKLLGLTSKDQGRIALSTLAADARIDELRIFYVSEVEKEERTGDADSFDPNKNRFGGRAVRNGRELSAELKPSNRSGTTSVGLTVKATDPQRKPLVGNVTFTLHPKFRPQTVTVQAIEGVAALEIEARQAFTVGATMDKDKNQLELDLGYIHGAPDAFYSRGT